MFRLLVILRSTDRVWTIDIQLKVHIPVTYKISARPPKWSFGNVYCSRTCESKELEPCGTKVPPDKNTHMTDMICDMRYVRKQCNLWKSFDSGMLHGTVHYVLITQIPFVKPMCRHISNRVWNIISYINLLRLNGCTSFPTLSRLTWQCKKDYHQQTYCCTRLPEMICMRWVKTNVEICYTSVNIRLQ